MRQSIGLLAVAILPACITGSVAGDSKRLLRTPTPAAVVDDEERAIASLNKLTAPLKSEASKVAEAVKLRGWLSTKKTVRDFFVRLRLDEGLTA
ncbi:hypothetical protein PI124_g15696 [Phytophthora idaei]|nr:hypothetical protein PI125_g15799 [Phytophthora idaei]KAG3239365.1 hypothetical protein PI124_g15696 [Phytophthora idaei]